MNFEDWLYINCTYREVSGEGSWSTTFSFTLWAIWYMRNQLIHNKKEFSLGAAKNFIQFRVREYLYLNTRGAQISHKSVVNIRWHPPPSGFIKLNTDSFALSNPSQSSAGGVFRDEFGNWISGFSQKVGLSTSLSAEMWAIRDGLKIAIDKGFYNLILETDCKVVVLLLNSTISQFHSLGTLISDCRNLLALFHEVEVHHVLQEANAAADCLAKMGAHSNSSFVMLDECPTALRFILYADVIGTTMPKTIATH
ncbi:hypothetical protein SLA2020_499130 [Shorea laevis]